MVTQQLSETNLVVKVYDQGELGLTTASAPNAESNVNRTKIKAGCMGKVYVMAESSALANIKVTTAAVPTLDFGAIQTKTLAVNTNGWTEILINGDTAVYWGLKVDDPSRVTKLIVQESSLLADGECISLVQAGFDAKHVAGTGEFDSTFV